MVNLDDYEKRLIGNLLEEIRKPVPKNLCPTLYRTLNYEDDCKLKERADVLAKKLGIGESDECECDVLGSECPTCEVDL